MYKNISRLIFWEKMGLGQNGVVLSFFEPKRRRVGTAFFFNSACTKMASFWKKMLQNDVVLQQFCSKRRRFAAVLFKTTSFWLVLKNKK